MSPLMKNLATVTTLATTALLLVADSPPEPDVQCLHPAQNVEFAVSGTCGAEGTLRILNEMDACHFSVEVAEDLNLPGFGSFQDENGKEESYDVHQGRWSLFDVRTRRWLGEEGAPPESADGGTPDAGAPMQSFQLSCQASREGSQVKLSCEEKRLESSDAPVLATCEALLTPR